MRILHVTHQYPPDRRGGVEVYTQAVARQQADQGHTVAVLHGWADRLNDAPVERLKTEDTRLSNDAPPSPVGHEAPSNNPQSSLIIYASTPRILRHPLEAFVRSFHNPAIDRAFADLIREFRPDVVHVQHLKGLSARLVQVARRLGVRVVWTLHDWWAFCGNAQLIRHTGQVCDGPRLWLNCADCAAHHEGVRLSALQTTVALAATPVVAALFAYRARLLSAALADADVLIAPTVFVRDRFAQQGLASARFRVVEHGIEDSRQTAEGRRMKDEGRIEEPESPISNYQSSITNHQSPITNHPSSIIHHPSSIVHRLRIGYIGGLAWQKGVHVLIEAFNQLPPAAAELTIYGDLRPFPDYVARLRGLARHPGIRFAGPFDAAERRSILAQLDLVVVPSVWPETSNLVIQEAFAAGLPVVASRIGALADRVQDGVNGRLVPPNDVDALAQALNELTQDSTGLARLRARVRPPRTLADHVAELMTIYRG